MLEDIKIAEKESMFNNFDKWIDFLDINKVKTFIRKNKLLNLNYEKSVLL